MLPLNELWDAWKIHWKKGVQECDLFGFLIYMCIEFVSKKKKIRLLCVCDSLQKITACNGTDITAQKLENLLGSTLQTVLMARMAVYRCKNKRGMIGFKARLLDLRISGL